MMAYPRDHQLFPPDKMLQPTISRPLNPTFQLEALTSLDKPLLLDKNQDNL
jgi:hypothetical protein